MQNRDYFCQFSWIMKVLDSCENEEQIETTSKLFQLYIKKWKSEMNYREVKIFNEHFENALKRKSLVRKKKKEGFLAKFSQFFLF